MVIDEDHIWASVNSQEQPATKEEISLASRRLGMKIPQVLASQLMILNGGHLDGEVPGAIDGILPVDEWELAKDYHWFDSVDDVDGLELLVVIANHSEDQLCLDYRKCGPKGVPGLTFIFCGVPPTETTLISDNIDTYLKELIFQKRERRKQ